MNRNARELSVLVDDGTAGAVDAAAVHAAVTAKGNLEAVLPGSGGVVHPGYFPLSWYRAADSRVVGGR